MAPELTLYTGQTPNGIKISMALEELGLPYKVYAIDISKNTQKEPWFLEINPNGRIPALTDHASPIDGKPIHVFESGAILRYLATHYDPDNKISYPAGSREDHETDMWLFFQNAGVGPMQGQANHFVRYAPEKIPYGVTRYTTETRRLYGVLNERLKKTGAYLVGDKLTIADLSTVGWVFSAAWSGVDINEFPELKKWEEGIAAREGAGKGLNVPTKNRFKELAFDKEAAEEAAKKSRDWMKREMAKESEKKY